MRHDWDILQYWISKRRLRIRRQLIVYIWNRSYPCKMYILVELRCWLIIVFSSKIPSISLSSIANIHLAIFNIFISISRCNHDDVFIYVSLSFVEANRENISKWACLRDITNFDGKHDIRKIAIENRNFLFD